MKFKLHIVLIFFSLSLSMCKKYPENTLWFKNIKKINFFDNVKLTAFIVNGTDSISLLNSYFGASVPNKNIRDMYFKPVSSEGVNLFGVGNFILSAPGGFQTLPVGYTYSKDKKKVSLYYYGITNLDTSVVKRNIFLDYGEWEILNLDKKGNRKIKKTVNNNIYELHFEKN